MSLSVVVSGSADATIGKDCIIYKMNAIHETSLVTVEP
jgi:hypothetical protein